MNLPWDKSLWLIFFFFFGLLVKAAAKAEWTTHPIGCEQYIACVAAADCDDTPRLVRELVAEPFFKVSLAGHARTVARGWVANRFGSPVAGKIGGPLSWLCSLLFWTMPGICCAASVRC